MLRVQAGFYVGVLVEDATISTALTISPGQRVSVSGDRSLLAAPAWGRVSDDTCWLANDGKCDDGSTGGYANCPLDTDATDCRKATSEAGFIVQARGSLSLSYVMLQGVTITLQNGGSLSLASSAVPEAVLTAAIGALSGAGSALRLVDVSLVEYLRSDTCWASNDGFCDDGGPGPLCDLGTDATDCATPPSATLTGTITVNEDGSRAVEGSLSWGWGRPVFSVSPSLLVVQRGAALVAHALLEHLAVDVAREQRVGVGRALRAEGHAAAPPAVVAPAHDRPELLGAAVAAHGDVVLHPEPPVDGGGGRHLPRPPRPGQHYPVRGVRPCARAWPPAQRSPTEQHPE